MLLGPWPLPFRSFSLGSTSPLCLKGLIVDGDALGKVTSPTPESASDTEHVVVAVELKLMPESGLAFCDFAGLLHMNLVKLGAADCILPSGPELPEDGSPASFSATISLVGL